MVWEIFAKVGKVIKRHRVPTKREALKIKKNLNNSGLGFNAKIRKVTAKKRRRRR